jgi:hypothetical protein
MARKLLLQLVDEESSANLMRRLFGVELNGRRHGISTKLTFYGEKLDSSLDAESALVVRTWDVVVARLMGATKRSRITEEVPQRPGTQRMPQMEFIRISKDNAKERLVLLWDLTDELIAKATRLHNEAIKQLTEDHAAVMEQREKELLLVHQQDIERLDWEHDEEFREMADTFLTEHYENLEASEKELAKYQRVAARVGKVYSPSEDSVEFSPYRYKKVCAYIESICSRTFLSSRWMC